MQSKQSLKVKIVGKLTDVTLSANQTLFEQMKISESEIRDRLALVDLSPARIASLRSISSLIDKEVDSVVDQFYKSQLEIDEIAVLIGDADTFYRLRKAQRQYILDLFSGCYDSHYVNNRLRIGLVHKRIGVEPKLYLSGVHKLKELLMSLLLKLVKDHEKFEEIASALDGLFYFDITLVFDTYIDSLFREVNLAKLKTEKYANGLEIQVAQRTSELERLSQVDSLTGLINQKEMRSRLARDLAVMKRRASHLSLVFMDLNGFKAVNDKLGHIHGDEVLKSLSRSILDSVREVDTTCRYGGDEFVIICPDSNSENTQEVCERIEADFKSKHNDLSLSFGIAYITSMEDLTIDQLIAKADNNMYRAKRNEDISICAQ